MKIEWGSHNWARSRIALTDTTRSRVRICRDQLVELGDGQVSDRPASTPPADLINILPRD